MTVTLRLYESNCYVFSDGNVIITVLPCVALCVRLWAAYPIDLSMTMPSVWRQCVWLWGSFHV